MADDLVARLRELANDQDMLAPDNTNDSAELREAADRIERLEEALRVIAKARENKPDNCSDEYLVWCCVDTARAALAGEKKDD
jgi:hypothetical protein